MSSLHPGDLQLWTFREGVLASVGHDLVLQAGGWTLTRDGDQIEARVDAATVTALGAHAKGRLQTGILSGRDLAAIHKSLHRDVLRSRVHPEVRWRGTANRTRTSVQLAGTLYLCGQAHPLALTGSRSGPVLQVTGTVVPSRWGIPPFRALLGTLRVADRVVVHGTVHGWAGSGAQAG